MMTITNATDGTTPSVTYEYLPRQRQPSDLASASEEELADAVAR